MLLGDAYQKENGQFSYRQIFRECYASVAIAQSRVSGDV